MDMLVVHSYYGEYQDDSTEMGVYTVDEFVSLMRKSFSPNYELIVRNDGDILTFIIMQGAKFEESRSYFVREFKK